jgi:predicted DNA-binding protein
MVRFQTFLPKPMIAALKELKRRTGIPVAEHLRRAIELYLKRNAK